MLSVDAFPVAAQEKQTSPESPDFLHHAQRLEGFALDGIETPNGTESFQFRAGIEVEFALIDPSKYRDYLAANEQTARESLEKHLASTEDSTHHQSIRDMHQERVERSRAYEHGLIRNPDAINGELDVSDDLLDEFRAYATDAINNLPANSEAEEQKRQKWLEQIPTFGIRELINFQLYQEFSKPTLADNAPPANGTLQDIDAYSDSQGWLEFRFGKGTLQSGYYDNEGMCEIRTAPCAPSEAIQRKRIIETRLVEIAGQFGVLVQTNHEREHINLSAYQNSATDGSYVPIIGQDQSRHGKTLDITAGIAVAFSDGLWINAKDMKWDYIFSGPDGPDLTFSPSRKTVRVMNGRLELRSKFREEDHALTWLMAGAITGLQKGHEAIRNEGYTVPAETSTYTVHRQAGFDKQADLQIQRGFENSVKTEDGFELDIFYNMMRAEAMTRNLVGDIEDTEGCDYFNSFVFSSVDIDDKGVPFIDLGKMQSRYAALEDKVKGYVAKFGGVDLAAMAKRLSDKLKVVRLESSNVIAGETRYNASSRAEGIDRIKNSPVAKLAYDEQVETVTTWLESAIPEPLAA